MVVVYSSITIFASIGLNKTNYNQIYKKSFNFGYTPGLGFELDLGPSAESGVSNFHFTIAPKM